MVTKWSEILKKHSPDTEARIREKVVGRASGLNPFRAGADFGPGDIVGRKDEIANVERAIRDGLRLFLSGSRGSGKA